jgi:hypothetical protein
MKRIFLILLALSGSVALFSQNENPFKQFGYDVLVASSSKGEFQEFHDQTDIVEIGSVLFNTQTNEIVKVLEKDETTIDISSATTAMSIDPLCEKYYWISPYVYVANNPIKFIDPDGRDIYRFDDKSGTFHLMEANKDATDKVMAYRQDKKTGEWKQNSKWYQVKTRMDAIEKGILSDGMNFKTSNNLIKVGGENQASLGGVQNFIVDFSEMIGVELSGYYLADKGTEKISNVHIGKYENNKYDKAYKSYNLHKDRPALVNKVYEHTDYHTHPSKASDSDRTRASGQDLRSKENTQKSHKQLKKFIILTKGYLPIEY